MVSCPAAGFVDDILLGCLDMKLLVVGGDFRFGRDREGDLSSLQRQAAGRFTLIRAADVEIDGCRVASSLIRRQLAAGQVRAAGRMLEKPYFIDGVVVHGAGRGRTLGFPTLNIASANAILPPGVFHTRVDISGRSYPSVTNIGSHPTFAAPAAACKVETHIPGFQRDDLRQKGPPALHRQDPRREEVRRRRGAGGTDPPRHRLPGHLTSRGFFVTV